MKQQKTTIHKLLLVKKDIWGDTRNTHPSGIYRLEICRLTDKDYPRIINYELATIELYPNLNEWLYLCYKFNRNIGPEKKIIFKQEIPLEYKNYLDIISEETTLADLGY